MQHSVPTLWFRAGRIHVHDWPTSLTRPRGMTAHGAQLVGPARLRWRIRSHLIAAGVRYDDRVGEARIGMPRHAPRTADLPAALERTLSWCHHRGVVAGVDEALRLALVRRLHDESGATVLLVTPDSATAHRWQQELAQAPDDAEHVAAVVTAHAASREMHWLGGRHDALAVDGLDRTPTALLDEFVGQSAALLRLGFAESAPDRHLDTWSEQLGPLLMSHHERRNEPRCERIHVPMPTELRARYDSAWHDFLGAFDRFVAIRGATGFAGFVREARDDPRQRPALRAWHEARRCAAYHQHKHAVVGDLLHRHRGRRIVVFTPDRTAAYQIAQTHLVPAITSELPHHERAALLDAFAAGRLPVLCGPRLLDSGVAEGSADVAILAGGGFGPAQRSCRCRRVHTTGVVYELVSQRTHEVSRAHRWGHSAADQAADVHQQRR